MAAITANGSGRNINNFATVLPTQGVDALVISISKDNIPIPTDSDGTNPVYTGANTTSYVYEGIANTSAEWTFEVLSTSGVTVTNVSNVFTVTAISADTGYFVIKASRVNYSPLYKQVGVYKVKAGSDAALLDNGITLIAFADRSDGTGFTLDYDESKDYFAILRSDTFIDTPVQADFYGLWQSMYKHPLTCKYDNVSYLKTSYCSWNVLGMAYSSMTPGSYYYKGTYNRIYFALFDWRLNGAGSARTTPHNVNTTQVGYYDLDNKVFSPLTSIAHVYPSSTDGHDIPTIIVSDDGHVIIIQEEMNGPSGTHNSPFEIYRSDAAEDISSFTKVATITGYNAYPNVMLGPNTGEILLFARYNGVGGHGHLYMYKSTDNGATWGTYTEVASCVDIIVGPSDWYFYPRIVLTSRANGMALTGTLNEGTSGTSPDGTTCASRYKVNVYLYSADGITWGNAQYQHGTAGSFSKNINTSGYITPAELYTHFVVSDVSAIAYRSADIQDSGMDENGVPYIVIREWERWNTSLNPDYSTKDNLTKGEYIYYFDVATGGWLYNEFTGVVKDDYAVDALDVSNIPVRAGRTIMNVYNNGAIDLISRRTTAKSDFYKLPFATIDAAGEALAGGVFKITATTTNNFGEGLVVGDYVAYTAQTLNASNTLTPIEEDVVFFRSTDKGATWTEVREPLISDKHGYATQSPITTSINNMQDSGYMGVFVGISKPLPAGTAYDHSNLAFVWGQIKS